jgi:alpha-D-xyloside xylohydrolase
MFMHTSAPVTCDFGATHAGSAKLFMADETLDLFLFWGKPARILDEYTSLTGKATMPPVWSFGTWMSRITYFSQEEGYEIARQLRQNRIPSDVIHFDTGWFQTDWQCDYVFAPDRFPDAQKMINDLLADGFHISLWQLPYFTPKNKYFPELIEKGLYVKNEKGGLPYEDVILDFSNPETVVWYQEKLEALLKMGVGAIKVDFGEGAPLNGYYASGKGGLYEHNLYPLRYNKTVADITQKTRNETIMWARSAWAGSQRYPLHWGGDASNTDIGMLTTLRSGLSLGLSGFSFWSHDIGGFVQSCPEELYRRWLPFGFLTSHTRVHGAPPTEPWYYGEDFTDAFRQSAELKYTLMPYILDQAEKCTQTGLPMLRALLIEYPEDPAVWQIDDQYLFGSDMMVAPLFESVQDRFVYLPADRWVDYQTGKSYDAGWHRIAAGEIPAVILVRKGAIIPQAPVAQSTDKIEWEKVKNIKY